MPLPPVNLPTGVSRGLARAFVRRVRGDFAKPVPVQEEAAVWLRVEFRKPDGVGTKIKTEDTHGGEQDSNPKTQVRSKSQTPNLKRRRSKPHLLVIGVLRFPWDLELAIWDFRA